MTETITSTNNTNNTFQNLGRTFQEKVVQALITDRIWASGFIEVFEGQIDECLEYSDLRLLANRYVEHHNKYKEFPSLELLVSVIKETLKTSNDQTLKTKIVSFLQKVATGKDTGDLSWVKEKAFSFCRQQKVKKALLESAELSESEEQYDVMVTKLKKAIIAGVPISDGLNYNEDIDARYSETYRRTIGHGIKEDARWFFKSERFIEAFRVEIVVSEAMRIGFLRNTFGYGFCVTDSTHAIDNPLTIMRTS